MSRQKNLYKIIVLGDSGVGKTSILNKYVNKNFSMIYKSTIGADFFMKDILLEDKNSIKLQIWDTAGNEKFHSLGTAFYRGTDACILVFDITNPKTFYNLQIWYDEFLLTKNPKNVEDFPFILLGNKTDLISDNSMQISDKQIKTFCENKNIKYYSISAKTDISVLNEILNNFAMDIHSNNKESILLDNDDIILHETKEDNKCCIIF